ncbi:hypothetical protein DFR58_11894 [Anaerobacterium chartisolvens]|uniref:Uncharacterized protein n=1 Tax=Anaerobacterium chartisolvens TaxID=1297424 RepID=A0A369AYL2_9FIRM|nr:hypothetical protein [Anaerobacterium chartisolvens]RCX13276.1 hypothetical protein DFR58_11894 [Anaerobacterium chartisolvens]
MDEIHGLLSRIIVDIALALLSLLFAYGAAAAGRLAQRIKAEASQIKSSERRKLLLDAIDDLEDITFKTVAQIEQTAAKELRAAVKDGRAGKSELIALSERAYNEIVSALTPECRSLIDKNFGSFSHYLVKTIEAKVLELKSREA